MSSPRLPPGQSDPGADEFGAAREMKRQRLRSALLRLSPGQLVAITLAVLTAIAVIAIRYLPWWVLLAIALGSFLALRYGIPFLLKQLLMLPFKAKGQALAGATIQLHSLKPAPFPSANDSEQHYWDAADLARYQEMNWYFLDVSIVPPLNRSEGFRLWEPGELLLIPASVRGNSLESLECEEVAIHDYRVFDGAFGADVQGKYDGAKRLLLHLGAKPGVRRVVFRYYLERFGEVDLLG
ncbi:MAG: hypothetical protein HC824_08845 [Synechococcales cyanobacterium RM1_1_8]|nr:hypothetical protein [Synechococcales cyanobacterium RM1_1_8]